MNRLNRKVRALPAVLLAFLVLAVSACRPVQVNWKIGRNVVISSGEWYLTEKEAGVLALQYKLEFDHYYGEIFGEDFWETEVTDGMTFEDYVIRYYIFEECKALLFLTEEAEHLGIRLSDEEETEADRAGAAYYQALSEDEKAFSETDLSSVCSVLRKYRLAEKCIDRISGNAAQLVSEEESRVADIQVIHLLTREDADAVKERLENGESFTAVAKDTSLDPDISYSVAKGDLLPELDELVFSLSAGEVSDAVSLSDGYYIVRVNESYNVLLSKNNREKLLSERRFESWRTTYEAYEGRKSISTDRSYWDALNLSGNGDFPYISLFE